MYLFIVLPALLLLAIVLIVGPALLPFAVVGIIVFGVVRAVRHHHPDHTLHTH
jgi:hypothetical protein